MNSIKQLCCVVLLLTLQVAQAEAPDFSKIVAQVKDSVVVIKTEVESRGRTARGPSGSGFVIAKDGYILTNRHVIFGVEKIYVQLVNKKVFQAKLIGEDEGTDIALLKIEAKGLQPVSIGNVEKLAVGSWVVAYGAPFGLEHTVTAGIVSAKGRALGTEQYVPFIQTDAAVNRGNSGGPLFNANGEVVGINSQIFSMTGGNMGLAFAIPMDLAMDVADQLRKEGRVSRGFLGVGYEELDFEKAQAFGLDEVKGALINAVTKDSPAAAGGLKVGDIVISVNGIEIQSAPELPFVVGRIRPGNDVEMVVLREGKAVELDITVGERSAGQVADSQPESSSTRGIGLEVVELSDRLRGNANVSYGVLVQRVMPGAGQEAGIREGDVLQMINQRTINSLDDYQDAINSLPELGSVAVLVVRRGVGPRFLVLKLGEE